MGLFSPSPKISCVYLLPISWKYHAETCAISLSILRLDITAVKIYKDMYACVTPIPCQHT